MWSWHRGRVGHSGHIKRARSLRATPPSSSSSKLNSAPVTKMPSHPPHTGHKEEKGYHCHVHTTSSTATTCHSSPSSTMRYLLRLQDHKVQHFTSISPPVPALHAARPVLSRQVSSLNPSKHNLFAAAAAFKFNPDFHKALF